MEPRPSAFLPGLWLHALPLPLSASGPWATHVFFTGKPVHACDRIAFHLHRDHTYHQTSPFGQLATICIGSFLYSLRQPVVFLPSFDHPGVEIELTAKY